MLGFRGLMDAGSDDDDDDDEEEDARGFFSAYYNANNKLPADVGACCVAAACAVPCALRLAT